MKFLINLDGIVVRDNVFEAVAGHFGKSDEVGDIIKKTERGGILYIENAIRCINYLGGVSIAEVRKVVQSIPMNRKVCDFIKAHSANCVVFTECMSCWTTDIESKLGVSIVGSEGIIENDKVIKITSVFRPENLVNCFEDSGESVTVVGCLPNVVDAMRNADVSIATGINTKPASVLYSVCDYVILNEGALCRQLSQLL